MKTKQHASTPWALLATALLLPLLLQFASLLLPAGARVWGFDAMSYLHHTMPWGLLAAPPLLFAALRAMDIDPLRTPTSLLLLAIALLPPLLWPMHTYFYGDGGLLIPQIHRFSVDGTADTELLMNLKSAPLTGALLLLAMHAGPALGKILPALMPTDALYPFRWLSVFSLLAAALSIARMTKGQQRLALLLALTGTAGVLLFSGYVEYYAPVFAAVAVYLVAAERTLAGKARLWPALVAFALAVGLHYLTLALLPSLVFLLAARNDGMREKFKLLRHADVRVGLAAGGIAIMAWVAVYFVGGFGDSDSRVVMPLTEQVDAAGTQAYTLLSSWHLLDFLNLLALLAPAAVIALLWTWIDRLRRKKFGDGIDAFHAMNVLLMGGFAFFANASLGLARDWDLLSPLGIVLLLAALSALRRRYNEHAAVALAMISFVLLLPWTQLHRDAPATAERFENILELDSNHLFGDYVLSGFDALRKYQRRAGNLREEIRLTKRMIEVLDYPQHYRELSRMAQLLKQSDPGTTVTLQEWMLARLGQRLGKLSAAGAAADYSISVHDIDSLAQAIGFLALGNGMYDRVRTGVETIALETRGGRPYPAIAGLGFYQLGAYDVAAGHLAAAVQEGFANPAVYLFLGNALALSRQYSASLSRFEEGVRLFPDDGMLRFTLGKYYVRAGIQPGRAAELLRWCVERGEPAEHLAEARQLLSQLGS